MKVIERKRRLHTVPLSSLADVAFLLLIFLILTGTVNESRRQDIMLPVSAQARPIAYEREFVISITVQGRFFYGEVELDAAELKRKTLEEVTRFPETVFFIKADAETTYEFIDPVINILKQNHIQNVVFMAEINLPQTLPVISEGRP